MFIKIRTLFFTILMFLVLSGIFVSDAFSAPVVSLPAEIEATPGNKVEIVIGISGVENVTIGGYALRLDYDESILSNPAIIEAGTLSEGNPNLVSGQPLDGVGKFSIGVFGLSVSQDGTLIKVQFDVSSDFTIKSQIVFTGIENKTRLFDVGFMSIASDFTNGFIVPPPKPVLSILPISHTFSSEGGEQKINVTSNVEWTVTENADWLSVNPATGSDNGNFTIVCQANTKSEQRTTVVLIGISHTVKGINISQQGVLSVLKVEPLVRSVPATEGSVTFDVSNTGTGTMTWIAEINPADTWLTIENGNSGTNSGTITVNYDSNTAAERSGTITIIAEGTSNSPQTVTITQAEFVPPPMLNASPISYTFVSGGGEQTINVTANVDWTVSKDADWLSLNLTNGSDNGSFKITCQPNTTTVQRTGKITISADGLDPILVTVFQKGVNPESSPLRNLRITNIHGNEFSVSWSSANQENGQIRYGTRMDDYANWLTAEDDRGANTVDDIHYVTINDLSSDTTYYFEVVSGNTIDKNSGNFYSVDTGPVLIPFGSCYAAGKVVKDDTATLALDSIVYITILEENGEPASATESVLVTEETSGYWAMELANIRNTTHDALSSYTCGISKIRAEADGGYDGIGKIEITATDAPPYAEDIILNPFVTITAAAGANGKIEPVGEISVDWYADQIFTITPDACFQVKDVLTDGESNGAITSHTFENITEDHTIEASFEPITYAINVISGNNGNISPSGNMAADCGSEQTFTITPVNECYQIADLLVDGESLGPVGIHTFSDVKANHTIEARFEIRKSVIKSSMGENGSISPLGDTEVTCGTSKVFTIAPNTGYKIANLVVDGNPVAPESSYTFENITSDHTIHATFVEEDSYLITATAGANGNITPLGDMTLKPGSNQCFDITTDTGGYVIEDVKVDGGSVGKVSRYCFPNIMANHTIDATFTLVEDCFVTVIRSEGGSILPGGDADGKSEVGCDSEAVFTITPEDCYFLYDVKIDNLSVGQNANPTLKPGQTLEAVFQKKAFVITASSELGGQIAPTGATSVNCGENQVFTITPEQGNEIRDVIVDGESVGVVPTYTFTTMTEDHTIHVTFDIIFHINPGWNMITLAMEPETTYTAKTLAETMNNSGGSITKIQEWTGSKWKTYNVGAPFGNFDLEMGKGYFLLAESASTWQMIGTEWSGDTYTFGKGWNLFGFPLEGPFTASTLSQAVNEKGGSITKVMRWDGSGWESYAVGAPFGDFGIRSKEGYFLLSDKKSDVNLQ